MRYLGRICNNCERLNIRVKQLETECDRQHNLLNDKVEETKRLMKSKLMLKEECEKLKRALESNIHSGKALNKEFSESYFKKYHRVMQTLAARKRELENHTARVEDVKLKGIYTKLIKEITTMVNSLEDNEEHEYNKSLEVKLDKGQKRNDRPTDCLPF